MDAVDFLKERYRMCHYKVGCQHCMIYKNMGSQGCTEWMVDNPEKTVEIVEQWSKEHPQKTMMQDFFEKFPNAPRKENGTPLICPKYVGYPKPKESCEDCINKFVQCWSRPMED